jgi:diguanylate cyclase (GGDEF)-like protein/PAS domain S-box-containing protein
MVTQEVQGRIIATLAEGSNEDLLRAVVSNAPILVFILDRDGVFTLAEGKGFMTLGLNKEDIIGKTVFDLEYALPKFVADIHRVLAGESFNSVVEGSRFIFETWYALQRDHNGEVTRCIGVWTDVTDRKRPEKALKKQTGEMATLLEVSRVILTSVDLEEVLAIIAKQLATLMDMSGCTLSRWDRDIDVVVTWFDWRVDPDEFALTPGTTFLLDEFPMTRPVLEKGQPIVVHATDTGVDPREITYIPNLGIKSLLMLPLTVSDRVIGLVELDKSVHREFNDDEIRFCQGLADQAAIAIERALLYKEVQDKLEQQTALREAGAVLSSTLDINALLHLIVEQMGKAINATSAYLSSFDEVTGISKVIAEYLSPQASPLEKVSDLKQEFNHRADFLETLEFVRARKPDVYHIDDLDLEEVTRKHMEQYGCKSSLEIPVQVRGHYTVIAELRESRYRREFTQDEITICEAIAQQATVALEQAHLYDQAQTEIDRRKQMEERLRYDAFHDTLTDLPNRALFMDRLERAIFRSNRNEKNRFGVLFLDLDRFKIINDSLGLHMGDMLLVEIAQRLKENLREVDTISRLGGDEFVILAEDITSALDTEGLAERILKQVAEPVDLNGHEVIVTTSVGIVLSDADYTQPEEYLRDADTAMYHAKSNGKARYELFSSTRRQMALNRLSLESELRKAIERQEFCIHYQPITSLKTGAIKGIEALLRWQHPTLGLVSPGQFIPIAEETGLIIPIGTWVLVEACRQAREWQTRYPYDPPLNVSVNISGKQLTHTEFVNQVEWIVRTSGLEGVNLNLEVAESVIMDDLSFAAFILNQLKDLGVSVYMDDFGTGYSSLSSLMNFPMDMIKIDRSFINKMDSEENEPGLVRSIISMAHELGMRVIGEGIETETQLTMLTELGCDFGQGFHISVPQDVQTIEHMIAENHSKLTGQILE